MKAVMDSQLLATDLADYLVRRGVPFRTTHDVVGRLVRVSEETGTPLSELSLDTLREAHEAFDEDVREAFEWERSVDARDTDGGTSLRAVRLQLEELNGRLATLRGA